MKAIALISGGLDSNLALRLIKEQGIEVIAVNFSASCFLSNEQTNYHKSNLENIAKELRIKLKTIDISKELFEIVKNPKYGHGSNLNPCIELTVGY